MGMSFLLSSVFSSRTFLCFFVIRGPYRTPFVLGSSLLVFKVTVFADILLSHIAAILSVVILCQRQRVRLMVYLVVRPIPVATINAIKFD